MRIANLLWQGVTHDLSKYSITEFRLVKYYTGKGSPVDEEKRHNNGKSSSFEHHIKHNKHHWEHWRDKVDQLPKRYESIPENIKKEMVCDIVAASKTYNKKNYTPDKPIEFVQNNKDYPQEFKDMILPLLKQHLTMG